MDLLRRLSTVEAQLARLSDQASQDPRYLAISLFYHGAYNLLISPPLLRSIGRQCLDQQFEEPLSPSQPRRMTGQDFGSEGQRRLSDSNPSPPDLAESNNAYVKLFALKHPLTSSSSVFSTMPPEPVVQHLVDAYFVHSHNQPYSYFQEERFQQLRSFGLLPKCLVLAVLASSVRFSNHEYFKGRTHEAMEAYAREAWLAVLNDHLTAENCPNLYVAQTTNILAIVDFTGAFYLIPPQA